MNITLFLLKTLQIQKNYCFQYDQIIYWCKLKVTYNKNGSRETV